MSENGYQHIEIEEEDGITSIFLNRPEKRNAMNRDVFLELESAFAQVGEDPSTRVLIITGRGTAFSAGLDLSEFQDFTRVDATTFRLLVRRLQRTYRALETMEKPVIAAVNGPALGAGMELALACDMVLASEEATFGLLEVNYGLVTDLGATQRLPRIVGTLRAKELIMTGRRISAAEAQAIGIANAVYPAARLLEEARALATRLKELSPTAVGLCKMAIDKSFGNSIDAGLEYEAQAQTICFQCIQDMLKSTTEGNEKG